MSRLPDPIVFVDPEPTKRPMLGAASVLNDLVDILNRHVVLPPHADIAIALWILSTHLINARNSAPLLPGAELIPVARVAPYLAIPSPEKRCGKTTLMGVLNRCVYRPLATANITPAALFRVLHAHQPTLLIDEADTFVHESGALRSILNSGHTRDTAFVDRVIKGEVRRFSTFGPKAIAGIGDPPDTVADRSIIIPMRRKSPTEQEREPLPPVSVFPIVHRCARITQDYALQLKGVRPDFPPELNDRQRDTWEVPLNLCDLAGKDWPARGRDSAIALCKRPAPVPSESISLLLACKRAFDESSSDRLATETLLAWLRNDPAHPLAAGRGDPTRWLAAQLRPFEIGPQTIRFKQGPEKKGYYRAQFDDAFARYLSDEA